MLGEGGSGIDPKAPLSAVESSTVFDFDATIGASNDGTSAWKNLIASPADGSAQTDYQLDITGMGFQGTQDEADARIVHNRLGYPNQPNHTGDFITKIAQSGRSGWLTFAYKHNDTNTRFLFDNRNTTNGAGVFARKMSSEIVQFFVSNGTGNTIASSSDTVPINTDTVTIISWDGSNVRFWLDNSGVGEEVSLSIPIDTSTLSDENLIYNINYTEQASTSFGANLLWHANLSGGNEYLDDTKANAIVEALSARHGVTYW